MSIYRRLTKYNYYTLVDSEYGGKTADFTSPTGVVNMAIQLNNMAMNSNTIYTSANFVGLTQEDIDDTYIIEYGNEKLKVLYVYPEGKYKQVFMQRF